MPRTGSTLHPPEPAGSLGPRAERPSRRPTHWTTGSAGAYWTSGSTSLSGPGAGPCLTESRVTGLSQAAAGARGHRDRCGRCRARDRHLASWGPQVGYESDSPSDLQVESAQPTPEPRRGGRGPWRAMDECLMKK